MKRNSYEGPERRTYLRLNTDYAVSYIRLSGDLQPIGGVVKGICSGNMSGAGIKFFASEEIPVGSFLEIHIKMPDSRKIITAIGRVARCESEKKLFGIALPFFWIGKEGKEMIDEYIKKLKLKMLRSEIKM